MFNPQDLDILRTRQVAERLANFVPPKGLLVTLCKAETLALGLSPLFNSFLIIERFMPGHNQSREESKSDNANMSNY